MQFIREVNKKMSMRKKGYLKNRKQINKKKKKNEKKWLFLLLLLPAILIPSVIIMNYHYNPLNSTKIIQTPITFQPGTSMNYDGGMQLNIGQFFIGNYTSLYFECNYSCIPITDGSYIYIEESFFTQTYRGIAALTQSSIWFIAPAFSTGYHSLNATINQLFSSSFYYNLNLTKYNNSYIVLNIFGSGISGFKINSMSGYWTEESK